MQVVHGAQHWVIISSLCIGLLLSSLESTIVSTALVSIAADFNNYEQSNWIVIIYLVTYSSFLIIFARLSDTTGRKPALLTGLCFFTLASLACGLARTLTQLIVFRALQGVGGAGIYALTLVISTEITPPERLGINSGLIGTVFATASAVGPVIGGAITSYSTWRWCFWLNVPSGAVVIALIILLLPKSTRPSTGFKTAFLRVDWLGGILCLAASILVVIPLQEGGSQFAWNGAPIIAMFAVGGTCWLVFAFWQAWISKHPTKRNILPIVPAHLVVHRVIAGCVLTSMLTGLSFTSTIIYLPQRFQVANNLSPAKAGVDLLPLVIVSALASTATGITLTKRNICAYMTAGGNALQLIGLGLLSSIQDSGATSPAIYGYQVIVGIGFGTTLSSSFILARIEVRREDIAPTMGALTQLRVFGGVVGVALCRVVLSSHVSGNLSEVISPVALQSIMASVTNIGLLPPEQAASVRRIYADGFALQSRILMYFAAANVVFALFCFRRHAKPLNTVDLPVEKQGENIQSSVVKAEDEKA